MSHASNTSLSKQQLATWVKALGGRGDVTQYDVDMFKWPYEQASRSFHNTKHRAEMGTAQIDKILHDRFVQTSGNSSVDVDVMSAQQAIAGQGHDIVYMHVDGAREHDSPIIEAIANKIANFVEFPRDEKRKIIKDENNKFSVKLSVGGKKDAVTALVAKIFAVDDGGIAHDQSANEFLSALVTAKFLEEHNVGIKHIATVATAIAATVPFLASTRTDKYPYDDGYMGALAARLKDANIGFSDKEIDNAMCLAVHTANRDIASFWSENIHELLDGTAALSPEFSPKLRASKDRFSLQDLLATSGEGIFAAIKKGFIPAANIPHRYKGFPNKADSVEHIIHVKQIEKNVDIACDYLSAKQVGIAFSAAVAAYIYESEHKVPGLVSAKLWASETQPVGECKMQDSDIVLQLLHSRSGDASASDVNDTRYDIPESPVAAFIYKIVGKEGVHELLETLCTTKRFVNGDPNAFVFLKAVKAKITEDNFGLLMEEFKRVALHPNKGIAGGENEALARKITKAATFLKREMQFPSAALGVV